jgi:hypothetical protein
MTKLTQNIACVSPVAKGFEPETNGNLRISRILRRWSSYTCSFPPSTWLCCIIMRSMHSGRESLDVISRRRHRQRHMQEVARYVYWLTPHHCLITLIKVIGFFAPSRQAERLDKYMYLAFYQPLLHFPTQPACILHDVRSLFVELYSPLSTMLPKNDIESTCERQL